MQPQKREVTTYYTYYEPTPIGIQVVARPYDDVRAFCVAAAIESVAGLIW